VVALVALATVTAVLGVPTAGATAQATDTPTEGEEAAMGTQLTAFMQHGAAQATDRVEEGMWRAAFDRANESERARLATGRRGELEDRLETLRAERERLQALRANGSISQVEYAARVSALNGRVDAMGEAVTGTERATNRAGLDVEGLRTLKREASNLTGPAVAGIARGLAGGDRGPPPEAGPPTDANPPTDVGPPTNDRNANATRAPGEGTPGPDAPVEGGPPDAGDSGNEQGGSDGGNDDAPVEDGPPDAGDSGNEQGGSDGGNDDAPVEDGPPDAGDSGNEQGGSDGGNDGSPGQGGPPGDGDAGSDDVGSDGSSGEGSDGNPG
jgi:hypothetical protein